MTSRADSRGRRSADQTSRAGADGSRGRPSDHDQQTSRADQTSRAEGRQVGRSSVGIMLYYAKRTQVCMDNCIHAHKPHASPIAYMPPQYPCIHVFLCANPSVATLPRYPIIFPGGPIKVKFILDTQVSVSAIKGIAVLFYLRSVVTNIAHKT